MTSSARLPDNMAFISADKERLSKIYSRKETLEILRDTKMFVSVMLEIIDYVFEHFALDMSRESPIFSK
ncbi:MAG: hypothetical protein ACLR70_06625 [Streptococcus thermophilus]